MQAWYREGRAAEGLQRFEDAASAYYSAAQLQPDNEEFMQLTKEAILEARKQYQAEQQQQRRRQGAAAEGAEQAAAGAAEGARQVPAAVGGSSTDGAATAADGSSGRAGAAPVHTRTQKHVVVEFAGGQQARGLHADGLERMQWQVAGRMR